MSARSQLILALRLARTKYRRGHAWSVCLVTQLITLSQRRTSATNYTNFGRLVVAAAGCFMRISSMTVGDFVRIAWGNPAGM